MATIDIASESDPHVRGAVTIARQLREAGYIVFFAGGCVRDWLTGQHPKDVDIVTNATPPEINDVFPRARKVGEAFGVMMVRRKGHHYEIATFRSDGDYSDGRRPDEVILHSSPEEDAARRDFTINGMFVDPESGEVVDYVGGEADIRAGVIRAIGDADRRFGEDHLRLLRAVRFAAQTGFEIESDTWSAMQRLAPRLAEIAVERVHHEITRFLVGPRPDHGFRLLADSGLLDVVVPEIRATEDAGDEVVTHVVAMLGQLREDAERVAAPAADDDDGSSAPAEPWRWLPAKPPDAGAHWPTESLAWACLLHALSPEVVEDVTGRLRISTHNRVRIAELVSQRAELDAVRELDLPALKRSLRRPGIDEHLAFHRLFHLADADAAERVAFALERLRAFTDCDPVDSLRPPLLLDGHDLKQLGYPPGPRFRDILEAQETEQMAGRLRTRAAAEAWLAQTFPK